MTDETILRQRPGDQPLPVPNDSPDIQSQVIADIVARRELGISRYSTALQPHNQRDAVRDLYEELLDGAMYARQLLAERDAILAADGTRDLVAKALDGSVDDCARCKVCDRQIDAVLAVIRELMSAAAAEILNRRQADGQAVLRLRAKLDEARAELAARDIDSEHHDHLVALQMAGATVRVTGRDGHVYDGWTATIAGIADHPTVLLDCSDGRRRSLPQVFTYEETGQ
jgi:hypothetical protein